MSRARKFLCDNECSNCEVVENAQLAVLLNVLALKYGQEVWDITNHVCPNMTCCPICRIDDFCHDTESGVAAIDSIHNDNKSCEVAEMAKEIFKEFQQ